MPSAPAVYGLVVALALAGFFCFSVGGSLSGHSLLSPSDEGAQTNKGNGAPLREVQLEEPLQEGEQQQPQQPEQVPRGGEAKEGKNLGRATVHEGDLLLALRQQQQQQQQKLQKEEQNQNASSGVIKKTPVDQTNNTGGGTAAVVNDSNGGGETEKNKDTDEANTTATTTTGVPSTNNSNSAPNSVAAVLSAAEERKEEVEEGPGSIAANINNRLMNCSNLMVPVKGSSSSSEFEENDESEESEEKSPPFPPSIGTNSTTKAALNETASSDSSTTTTTEEAFFHLLAHVASGFKRCRRSVGGNVDTEESSPPRSPSSRSTEERAEVFALNTLVRVGSALVCPGGAAQLGDDPQALLLRFFVAHPMAIRHPANESPVSGAPPIPGGDLGESAVNQTTSIQGSESSSSPQPAPSAAQEAPQQQLCFSGSPDLVPELGLVAEDDWKGLLAEAREVVARGVRFGKPEETALRKTIGGLLHRNPTLRDRLLEVARVVAPEQCTPPGEEPLQQVMVQDTVHREEPPEDNQRFAKQLISDGEDQQKQRRK